MLSAFGVVTVMSAQERDADALEDYRGLFWRRPWLSVVLTAAMLSLAGIPLTAGFIGKFYIVTAGLGSALLMLVIILAVNSAISLFYYLRVVVVMFARLPEARQVSPVAALSLASGLSLAVLTVLVVVLGIYPTPFIHLIEATVTALIG